MFAELLAACIGTGGPVLEQQLEPIMESLQSAMRFVTLLASLTRLAENLLGGGGNEQTCALVRVFFLNWGELLPRS